MNNKTILINKNSFEIFLKIDNGIFINNLYRKTELWNYSYLWSILNLFEKKDLISTIKQGRIRILNLTDKGEKLKKYLFKVKELMGEAYEGYNRS